MRGDKSIFFLLFICLLSYSSVIGEEGEDHSCSGRTVCQHGSEGSKVIRPEDITPPKSSELREDGERQRRWLSHPMSRLVLNPQDGSHTPVEHRPEPGMPLRAAFFYGKRYRSFTALTTYLKGESTDNPIQMGPKLAFDTGTITTQTSGERRDEGTFHVTSRAEASLTGNKLTISIPDTNFGRVEARKSVNIDQYPQLLVRLSEADADFTLKVTSQKLADHNISDIKIDRVRSPGSYLFNVKQAVNKVLEERDIPRWEGKQDMELRLFSVAGESVTLDCVQFVHVDRTLFKAGTDQRRSEWTPHAVSATGSTDGATVRSTDYFYDTHTVVRRYEFDKRTNTDRLVVGGQSPNHLKYIPEKNTIVIEREHLHYAISAEDGDKFTFYPRLSDFLSSSNEQQRPSSEGGFWTLETRKNMFISLGVSTPEEGVETAIDRARTPVVGRDVQTVLEKRKQDWNDYLKSVPRPGNFTLNHVDSKGVTPREIKRNYYVAWVYLRNQILPPAPEIDFPFPQLAGPGKASTTATGPDPAVVSNAWDSMVNLQLYAFVKPNLAWEIFRGFMETVSPDGYLRAKETLPTRWAQTAMMLYKRTEDEDTLRSVYPTLKKYILWKINNPWWKATELSPDMSGATNAAFAVHALVDAAFMTEIAREVKPGDVQLWKKERSDLFERYLNDNWNEPNGFPYQWGTNGPGWTTATTGGLYVKGWNDNPYKNTIKQRFSGNFGSAINGNEFHIYAPDEPFVGFHGSGSKYPLYSYAVYGLIEEGMIERAETMIEAGCRDIARSNVFSEHYQTNGNGNIIPSGNRPSGFGASQLIDLVLMKNGVRIDRAHPVLVGLNHEGAVSNLPFNQRRIALGYNPEDNTFTMFSADDQFKKCASYRIAPGDLTSVKNVCDEK